MKKSPIQYVEYSKMRGQGPAFHIIVKYGLDFDDRTRTAPGIWLSVGVRPPSIGSLVGK